MELAAYKEHKELEKLEKERMREDKVELSPLAKGGKFDSQMMGRQQGLLLQRVEAFIDSRKRNPLKQEGKSNALSPYKFQADLTEWKSLDQALNICRNNDTIKYARYVAFHSKFARPMYRIGS